MHAATRTAAAGTFACLVDVIFLASADALTINRIASLNMFSSHLLLSFTRLDGQSCLHITGPSSYASAIK